MFMMISLLEGYNNCTNHRIEAYCKVFSLYMVMVRFECEVLLRMTVMRSSDVGCNSVDILNVCYPVYQRHFFVFAQT